MHSSVAGAIGDAGASLVGRRCNGMPAVKEGGEGRLFAGATTRVARGERAVCIVLGSPCLARAAAAEPPANPDSIDTWRAALFGPTAEIDDRIGGHFALVYVDFASRCTVLVTDRFGSYSLYYRQTVDGLAFADRADALFDDKPSLSAQAIFDYLYFHYIPGPATVHEGVQKVEPGHVMRWNNGHLTEEIYWARRAKAALYTEFSAARDDFHRLLRDAVAEERNAGTVGAFLSGGTDSSTIVGLLAERSVCPVKSYSIGFDVEGYDEAAYARLAAERYGSDHRVYYMTPDDLVARIPSVAARLDQPFGNSSLLPAMICAERAKEDGITKLLAGDGGDELFGGNTRYSKQKVFGWYNAVPALVRTGFIEPMTRSDLAARLPLFSKVKSYVEQANIPLPDRLETYNLLEREGIDSLLPDAWLSKLNTTQPRTMQRVIWKNLAARNLTDRMLEFDWKFTLADNDLRKVRYAADMAGIQVGFPLLSNGLTDFSLRLKPDWKVQRLKLRWFFKRALADFLPHEIIRKKKHGFGLPFGSWVLEHDALGRLARNAIHDLVARGLLRSDYVNMLFSERLPAHPYYYGELVWILMILELWLQAHCPDWNIDT